MQMILSFMFLFFGCYNLINYSVKLNEKQKAHIVELMWSVVLVVGSLKTFIDVYQDNNLLDKGYTNLSDNLLKFYMAGTITDFILCYKDYNTYFTKITIFHHIVWVGISSLALYTNSSIYGTFVYLIEVPCIPKCIFKIFPRTKNTIIFARTWIIFRIFYFFNVVLFFQERFKTHNVQMYKTTPLWWLALTMHIWWGYKLIKKCELESRIWFMEIRRPYLLNKEVRPKYRGFIQHILMKYYIIQCSFVMYILYTSSSDLKWLYYFYGLSMLLNTYASHKLHCNDLLNNDIKDEIFYSKLDYISIQSIIFSRLLLLTTSLYTNFVNYALTMCYFLIIYQIFRKKYEKIYDFNNNKIIPSYNIPHHIFGISIYFLYGIVSFYNYKTNINNIISWCIYFVAFICYYSKFFIEINNPYYNQHDIAHIIININYYISSICDIV